MKRALFLLAFMPLFAFGQNYYFGENTNFKSNIKSPEEFLAYKIGDHHTRYDKIVEYMRYLESASERVKLEVFGESVEKRPQIILTITSLANHQNLESIRVQHLKLSDPTINGNINKDIPVVVQLGFNVHGNEASGGEASLLAAYYLAAAESTEIDAILSNAVVLIEPVLNPDGRDRFVSWVNMNRSALASPDSYDREHTEAWPGGRTNHYWFDLNRDWLPLVQQESRNRVERYHLWRPNVITDHHEMGTNSTFFFEPTKPGSENRLVPMENYNKLNKLFALGYSSVLDKVGHYYDSGLSFDNSYPGYGSTYGDINGGLAILFEQASSRGLVQLTDLGYVMPFSLGIQNQLSGAISTLNTAVENRTMLNDYMHRYYTDAYQAAKSSKCKGYIFGDKNDKGRTNDFLKLLIAHKIDVYPSDSDIKRDGNEFQAGSSYIVPTEQAQYRMVQTMFETYLSFPDSLFYDATAWSMIHAYGLPYAELGKFTPNSTALLNTVPDIKVNKFEESDYGYLINWSEYYSAEFLNLLQRHGIKVKAAYEPCEINYNNKTVRFSRGSIFIPVQYQDLKSQALYNILKGISEKTKISVYPLGSSLTASGPLMGNSAFKSLTIPKVLMLTGDGVSSSSAGSIWHLLDTRVKMTFTKIDISRLRRVNLYNYNTLIIPSGSYSSLSKELNSKLKDWIANGGKVLAFGSSMSWLKANKLIAYETNSRKSESERLDYNTARLASGKHSIGGVYCKADLDITHPLGFGYESRDIIVFKNNRSFIKESGSSTSNIMVYKAYPVLSGYVSKENKELFKECVSLKQFRLGNGTINLFIDDPVFRGAMRGTDKIVMNAIFF